ncbi:MAG: hypothetical protein IJ124_05880 [Clostridia bacterium]|nr:hypothetical protein [Clostridia bacterium]
MVRDIAELLNIEPPRVRRVRKLRSGDGIASYYPLDNTVEIVTSAMDADVAFALAHELRHAWQHVHAPEMWQGYRTRLACGSVEAYNMQPAEIDANAFAQIIMVDAIGLKPLFRGLSPRVRAAINARAAEVARCLKTL